MNQTLVENTKANKKKMPTVIDVLWVGLMRFGELFKHSIGNSFGCFAEQHVWTQKSDSSIGIQGNAMPYYWLSFLLLFVSPFVLYYVSLCACFEAETSKIECKEKIKWNKIKSQHIFHCSILLILVYSFIVRFKFNLKIYLLSFIFYFDFFFFFWIPLEREVVVFTSV